MRLNFIFLFLLTISSSSFSNTLLNNEPISQPEKDKFMFLINSDPQMGDEHTKKKGLQTLNQLLEMFVEETNKRKGKDKPDFVVWAGDLVWDPFQNAFDNFQRIVSKMNVPSVLVHGNHDGYNDDPKFLNLQENLSGYRKLNYSFGYGKWHFVVISAQEKYFKPEQKKAMLKWLDNELKQNKDKQIMLFMHYHILPTGLSQMEFYTYFPMSFKNEMLDTIVRYNNVKYVFSGHVHIGIKASIKTARNYKGTNFILAPTPVFARPFGEEYPKFREKGGKFDKRGFYTEIHVDGDKVQIIGRKMNNSFKKKYPTKFKTFDQNEDPRAFIPEGQLPINDELYNGDFNLDLIGWSSSYRYQRDKKTVFSNTVKDGKSYLEFQASYGSWTFDEYMENYQIIKYKDNMHMSIDFSSMPAKFKGNGGYFRVFAYDKAGELMKVLLFHWGTQEEKVRFMHQSWGFNATGDRVSALWLDKKIKTGNMLSYKIEVAPLSNHKLEVELNKLFEKISKDEQRKINHIGVAYGVWGRISMGGRKYSSRLLVDSINITTNNTKELSDAVLLNGQAITKIDQFLEFGAIFKKNKNKKTKN